MRIDQLRLVGIRCFEDTGDLSLASKFNLIVGQNNAGKSTLLKGILNLQGMTIDWQDVRPHTTDVWISILLGDAKPTDAFMVGSYSGTSMRYSQVFAGNSQSYHDAPTVFYGIGPQVFHATRPNHQLVPFIAKRKAIRFNQVINASALTPVTGTFENLYANVDLLSTDGHPQNEAYKAAIQEILGLKITTQPSQGGKDAGFYFDEEKFVTLDRMGDGVSEIVALITELCLARDKIFVLEEPETNLHPKGLKALLKLIRSSAEHNQFIIATHSNVVVRELGGEADSKVFRVYRDDGSTVAPSSVEEVERSPAAHIRLLRDLGYEFTDFSLHEGWLFLEESSAEQIVRDILVPMFVPELKGRLRTFSAAGVNKLEPTLAEFQRLITFVHLQPAYEGRIWVRADGDRQGLEAVEKMQQTFSGLGSNALASFSRPQFELYYPSQFTDAVEQILAIQDKTERGRQKAELLKEVLAWTSSNADEAKTQWAESAAEVISMLREIAQEIVE
jgi:predicted ATPase